MVAVKNGKLGSMPEIISPTFILDEVHLTYLVSFARSPEELEITYLLIALSLSTRAIFLFLFLPQLIMSESIASLKDKHAKKYAGQASSRTRKAERWKVYS